MQKVDVLDQYDFNKFMSGGYHIDQLGQIWFIHANSRNLIHVYSSDFSLLKVISIEGIENEVQRILPSVFKGNVGRVFSTEEGILLGMGNPIVCAITETGQIKQVRSLSTLFTPNQYYFRLSGMADGKIVLITEPGDHGNLIAISKHKNDSILSDSFYEFRYLNDTFSIPEAHFPNFQNLDCLNYNPSISIGTILKEIRQRPQDSSLPYIHHSPQMKIVKLKELENGNIVLLILSDTINRSGTPNKNMPYYIFIISGNTGEVIRYFSPDDRSLHQWNYYGDIIKLPNNRYLFKSFETLFVYNGEFELISTISLAKKYSVLKGLSLLNNHKELIYWGDQKNRILYTSIFSGDIEEYLSRTVKEVKSLLKA